MSDDPLLAGKIPMWRWYLTSPTLLRPDLFHEDIFHPTPESKRWRESIRDRCPICNNDSLCHGEEVSVEVGFVQVSPDSCDVCGYLQRGAYDDVTPDSTFFQFCWELQVAPYEQLR